LSGCEANKANKNNNDNNNQATIDQNVEELNDNNQSQSSPKKNQYLGDSEEPIVLYHGITLDDADKRIGIRTNENEDEVNYIMKKYSREYYLYSIQQFLGKENCIAEIRGYVCA
jgi:hypothetical protein